MLRISSDKKSGLRILCLGAHSDDIEIGCGGMMLKVLVSGAVSHVDWIVLSASGVRRAEAESSARGFLGSGLATGIRTESFRDGYFPAQFEAIKDYFESLKSTVDPDIVLTHHRSDRHQDHRVVSDLTWNTFRGHLILEYEIPKYDGDVGKPNLFVELNKEIYERKLELLEEHFASQRQKHWFDRELFTSLLRIRGMEIGVTYAEAFHARKVLFE